MIRWSIGHGLILLRWCNNSNVSWCLNWKWMLFRQKCAQWKSSNKRVSFFPSKNTICRRKIWLWFRTVYYPPLRPGNELIFILANFYLLRKQRDKLSQFMEHSASSTRGKTSGWMSLVLKGKRCKRLLDRISIRISHYHYDLDVGQL